MIDHPWSGVLQLALPFWSICHRSAAVTCEAVCMSSDHLKSIGVSGAFRNAVWKSIGCFSCQGKSESVWSILDSFRFYSGTKCKALREMRFRHIFADGCWSCVVVDPGGEITWSECSQQNLTFYTVTLQYFSHSIGFLRACLTVC